ncbi:MAG: hypothetical protein ACFBSG_15615 [Leptolyngbyaceae cyanobacterium]
MKAEILSNLQKSAKLPAGGDLSQDVLERGYGLCAQVLAPRTTAIGFR